jgi:hypothetical protein
VIKSVEKSFDFLLAFLDLSVKFITKSLQLFFLLCCLDDIVRLAVFSGIRLSTT